MSDLPEPIRYDPEADQPQMGIISGEPAEVYHAADPVSHSMVEKSFRPPGCPEIYDAIYNRKTIEKKVTPDMEFGRHWHAMTLQPAEFNERYLVPDAPIEKSRIKPSKAGWKGKRYWEECQAEAASRGDEIVLFQDYERMRAMRGALLGHEYARLLLEASHTHELTMRSATRGLSWQARFDALGELDCLGYKGLAMIDLKKVSTAHWHKLEQRFESLGYHRQAAWYMRVAQDCGAEIKYAFYIAVEDAEPYRVRVKQMSEATLKQANEEIDEDLNALRWCYSNDTWPKERPTIETFNLSGHYDGHPDRWGWLGKICDEMAERSTVAEAMADEEAVAEMTKVGT